MKKIVYLYAVAVVLLAVCLDSSAEVHVTLEMEHVEYLQYEKMTAFVTIYNDDDYKVIIDSSKTNRTDALRFHIRHNMKTPAVRINRLALLDYIELKPGEKKTLMYDLGMWYSVSPVGSYDILAEFEHGGRKWQSKRVLIDVVDGMQAASVTRSIPGDPNRSRTYSLRYWTRERKEYMFLRVEEKASEMVYGVFLLGELIRVVKPALNVDRNGNVTIIHQSSRSVFSKTTFKSEAYSVRFVDQVYINEDGVPFINDKK